ncbi:MAG TPA: VCBS repeat-containing protein, partial [Longimicrobiales bacterium]|nr:VCBS repeat-containing protein [Longimicrobiales bacterium]
MPRRPDPAERPGRLRRGAAALLLGGAVAVAVLLGREWPGHPTSDAAVDPTAALERHGFFLDEVAAEVGIHFRHEAPDLDPRLEPIMPVIAATGASVSVADFDGDGWPDLYTTTSVQGVRNPLYRNRGDGTFEDVAGRLGVADVNRPGTGVSMGSVWGDYDNDGDEDLFLVAAGGSLETPPAERARSMLFENRGDGTFRVDETFPDLRIIGMAAAWADCDGDGWLDLVVTGYDALLLFRNRRGVLVADDGFRGPPGFWAGVAWGD